MGFCRVAWEAAAAKANQNVSQLEALEAQLAAARATIRDLEADLASARRAQSISSVSPDTLVAAQRQLEEVEAENVALKAQLADALARSPSPSGDEAARAALEVSNLSLTAPEPPIRASTEPNPYPGPNPNPTSMEGGAL